MPEELEIVAMRNYEGTTTARDVAAVFFRQRKLFLISFAVVLCIGVLYALFVPSYKAEMKVLVRRGRIDATVTPTETGSAVERQDVTEEEMNSEVELLQDEDILRKVVLASGLAESQHWYSPLGRNGREEQIARAVKRLAGKISVQPVRKSHVIAISYNSSDPRLSAAVLKSLAAAYLAKHTEIRRPTGQQDFFERQMQLDGRLPAKTPPCSALWRFAGSDSAGRAVEGGAGIQQFTKRKRLCRQFPATHQRGWIARTCSSRKRCG